MRGVFALLVPLLALAPLQGEIELVESAPVETSLDHADLRNADVVWLEMVGRATRSLDFAEFYASDKPGSRLAAVVEAIEAAAARGVRVRFLAEAKFAETYPETLDRLARTKGIEVRRWKVADSFGGVLHAKYFVADGREVFVGSQNFDWRSLEHIFELGLFVRAPATARAFQQLFDVDWSIAGGVQPGHALASWPAPLSAPERIGDATVTPVFSPRAGLPDERLWDLPAIVALIDGAKERVRLSALGYRATDRDGRYFAELENGLRRAAARGVKVELLLADWSKRKGTIEGLQGLEPLPSIDVKLVTIPQHSSGHIGYARVLHAKYVVVDGARAWLGTSNFERDYFEESRNAGLAIEGGEVPPRLDRLFEELWTSSYAAAVDPCATYVPPRIGD